MKEVTHEPPMSVRERAYALRFDPATPPPADETRMTIGGIPIASCGNLTGLQGKSKTGKTAVVSGAIGAALRGEFVAQGDTICIEWIGTAKGAVIHLDTEQSPSDWYSLVQRGISRSGIAFDSDRLISLPLTMFSRSERLEILRQTLVHERDRVGVIDLVVIDGLADLCTSPNDEREALELISVLMALSHEFNTPILCVVHENPSSEAHSPKTRGHLGSELNRKAFANLRIDKNSETNVSTLYGTDMRKRDIPREQGFCFAWCDTSGMHTFRGRSAGLKAAQAEAKAIADTRNYFTLLFESIGNKGAFPVSTPDELVTAHRETIGKEGLPTREAMKKRMQKATTLGVLRKSSRDTWSLILSGKSGNDREPSDCPASVSGKGNKGVYL